MAVHKKYNNGTKSNALGRGLDALISTEGVRTQGSSTINEIPLDQIEAIPFLPRREFDDEALSIARIRNRAAIDLYAACVDTDTWPAYPEVINLTPPPAWLYDDDMEID